MPRPRMTSSKPDSLKEPGRAGGALFAVSRLLLALWISLFGLLTPGDALAQQAAPFSVDLPFSTLGYGTLQLSEGQQGRTVNLFVPRNLQLQPGSYVELTITHTPEVPDKPSSLSISLNNVPLGVIPLTAENAEPTTYRYPVDGILDTGRNRLEIALDSGATCEEAGARVDVAILEESFFHLEYGLSQYPADLAYYPLPFYEESFQPVETLLVLPNDPTSLELSAAATVSAGLGAISKGEVRLTAVTLSDLTAEMRAQSHLIVVGTPQRNRLLERLSLPRPISPSTMQEEWGVLQMLPSPWNPYRMVLVISGLTDAGVLKAAQTLNRPIRFPPLRGPVALVAEVRPASEEEAQSYATDYTLADLGYDDEVFYGSQPQSVTYYFRLPLAWNLQSRPRFVLSFSHSQVVNPVNSVIGVSLNGLPLASALLDEDNAQDGVLEVELPPWALRAGVNRLRVDVEMNRPGGTKCGDLDDTRLWTVLRKDSYIHLAYTRSNAEPHLGLFPYPFNSDRNLTDLLVVVPDTVASAILQSLTSLAIGMGASAKGQYMTFRVRRVADASPEMLEKHHLIFLGTPTTHGLLAQVNDRLPQPFEEGSNLLKPVVDTVVLVPDPARTMGLLEEIASPWNADKTLLVITGTAEEGVGWALHVLLNYTRKLKGNLAIAEQYLTQTEEGEVIPAYDFFSTETRVEMRQPQSQVQPMLPDREQWIALADRWW